MTTAQAVVGDSRQINLDASQMLRMLDLISLARLASFGKVFFNFLYVHSHEKRYIDRVRLNNHLVKTLQVNR